jgi:thymidylate synthase (FAD)
MKLIEPKAELLLQPEGLEGVYKQIELCGRTCYKSTDKITDESAKPFVERMIASKHTAMLEQGTVYLKFFGASESLHLYICSPYSRVRTSGETIDGNYIVVYYVTTNLRVLVENDLLGHLKYVCEPTKYHEKRYTIKFTTDRGVSHELVRHRVFSFAQESTRYCNYSKDKFGKEITFIIPSWCPNYDETDWDELLHTLQKTEDGYFALLAKGCTPQQARQVLPNALKTEVCMTGFASDWRFFFDLRYYGETGKPHPDMEVVATMARSEFMKAGLWDDIMSYPSKF